MRHILTAALATLTVSTPFLFADDDRSPFCNATTLKGTYVVTINGTRPAPQVLPAFQGMPPGTIEQVIGVFLLSFDGIGSQRSYGLAIKGSLSGLYPTEGGAGSYTVHADCTGSFIGNTPGVPFPLVNRMVIFSGGKEFETIVTSPQAVMVRATGKRVE